MFRGLALMNFAGLHQSIYEGHRAHSSVSDFFDQVVGGDWRNRYRFQASQKRYFDGLRECIGEALGIPSWLELGIGRSMRCN